MCDDGILKTPDRGTNSDRTWDDKEFERELVLSTLRTEAERLGNTSDYVFLTQQNKNVNTVDSTTQDGAELYGNASNSQVMIQQNPNFNTLDHAVQHEDEYYENTTNSQFLRQDNPNIDIYEISPNKVISEFTSSVVEKEVFDDIIAKVQKHSKAKTINVVRLGSKWAEHRVFALSMMVYGTINPYVMDVLGKCVVVEDAEKEKLNLLPAGHWKRFYFDCNVAALFIKSCESPGTLSKHHAMLGIMLDSRDLVQLPLYAEGFYFLLLVNFKEKVFEVLYPNTKIELISGHANFAIDKFKMAFKLAYKHSDVRIDDMETIFRSVCASEKNSDSGVYVMELIRHQTGGKTLCFQPCLRESLTYYMLAYPFNEKMLPETKKSLKKYHHRISHTTTSRMDTTLLGMNRLEQVRKEQKTLSRL